MASINQNSKVDYEAIKISYTDKDYTNILDDLINSISGITEKYESTDANDPRNGINKAYGNTWGYALLLPRFTNFGTFPQFSNREKKCCNYI